jgi:hypothetical protein
VAEFFSMPRNDQREALLVAAERSGRPPHLLEKDVWVVWALRHLFAGAHAPHLVFKGGTLLSKAWNVIRRFSEDVDLTYDVRTIAPELTEGGETAWPKTRSQAKKWTDEIRGRLAQRVATQLGPALGEALSAQNLRATVRVEDATIFIDYDSLTLGTGYVKPSVLLEFGARSTGEPSATRPITCDAADHVPGVDFPRADAAVMLPERTFWEKATAIHVYCVGGRFRGGDRFARHWHDVTRLDLAGIAERARSDRALAQAVVENKSAFFAEKTADGQPIDYRVAVQGGLQLVPVDAARAALADDYQRMVEDGLLLDDAEPFDDLLEQCRAIADRVNQAA